jgi:hypothetical protein
VSQVNFFMIDTDELAFVAAVIARGDTHVLPSGSSLATLPRTLTALPAHSDAPGITLVHAGMRPVPPVFSDAYKDPHIELSRCRLHGSGVLESGRLFAKIGWLDPPDDNKLYLSWYRALERWIKSRYVRTSTGWWIGPGAQEWAAGGGQLQFGGPGALVSSWKPPHP